MPVCPVHSPASKVLKVAQTPSIHQQQKISNWPTCALLIVNKSEPLGELLNDIKLDILVITETCLTPTHGDNDIAAFCPAPAPNKSCCIDPFPTVLLKRFADKVVPLIITILNLLLSSGFFPSSLNHAIICPVRKHSRSQWAIHWLLPGSVTPLKRPS